MKKKLEKRWRKEHKCFDCPSRVEPIIIYPAGNTIPLIKNYPIRCYECRKKILLKLKMNSKKQRINSSYSELNISKNSKRHRDKKKALKICVNCPNYLEPIITYPAGDKTPPIISYPIRCYKCRKKHNSRGKIYKMKKEINNNKCCVTII